MRVLYLHQFFATREGSQGTRSYELARHLTSAGHEVVMVTAARGPAAVRRAVEGIDVVEVAGASADYMTATGHTYGRRMLGFARFSAGATAAALRAARPDVVLASSPPLTVAFPGALASRRHGAPLVFEVRDLWPEAPIQMGALRNPVAQRGARALERGAYRSAVHIVALSPGIRDGVIAAGVAGERVTVIPNASDLDLFDPDLDPGDLRARLGLEGAFVCSYFGSMGAANDVGQVVEAATLLRDRGDAAREIAFVLQGEGRQRPAIEAELRRRGLRNVTVLGPADKRSVARLAAASDACLCVFKDVPVLATNSPNKLFDVFAAGRPAVVNTDGWQRELVERNRAGLAARPGDPADLARQLQRLRDDPGLSAEMGRNARRLAESEFARPVLAERMRRVLERAAGGGPGRPAGLDAADRPGSER